MFEYLYNSFFKAKKSSDEDENMLNNTVKYHTDLALNPLDKNMEYLEDISLYKYCSSHTCSIELKFFYKKKIVDNINISGGVYIKNDEFFSKYDINYSPIFDRGKILLNFNIFKNNKLIDCDSVSFNYVINKIDNENSKNITFNTEKYKILIIMGLNKKYFIKDIICFKLFK